LGLGNFQTFFETRCNISFILLFK